MVITDSSLYLKASLLRSMQAVLMANPDAYTSKAAAECLQISVKSLNKLFEIHVSVGNIQKAAVDVPKPKLDAFLCPLNREKFIENLYKLSISEQ